MSTKVPIVATEVPATVEPTASRPPYFKFRYMATGDSLAKYLGDSLGFPQNLKQAAMPILIIKLLDVYNHICFWDASMKIELICVLNSALNQGLITGVDELANQVCGKDWIPKIGNVKWVKKMEERSMHDKTEKTKAYITTSVKDLIKFFRNGWIHNEGIKDAKK
ncbi:hypothetical protein CTI12_AA128950 [Artemisia annua]|uniref:Uncharacterized protein n=1 Tax=Artemisia annua TaxID=35608 RepID=A0A2U1PPK0_ARTAN|nr:hypothetical protein CTI12_AA128950 [Artemisia annua]